MLTNNWYGYYKSNMRNRVITNAAKTTDGTIVNCGYSISNSGVALGHLMLQNTSVVYKTTVAGIILGSGTTAPTLNDYKLEQLITSGLSCSVASVYNDDGTVTRKITATNTSSQEITIAEIGHQCQIYTGENTTSGSKFCLFERTLLDAPVTIPAGGVGVIDYTVRLVAPTE